MINIVKYELKKITDIKFVIVLLIILVTGIGYFSICINKSGENYDVNNINDVVLQYAGEKAVNNPEKFRNDYFDHMETMNLEYENQDALINGIMSREEYSKYAQKLAKAKRYKAAWEYLYNESDIIIDKGGWIIFREYLNYFFKVGLLQPLLIILVLFIVFLLFVQDRGRGRYELLISTPNGRIKTYIAKMIVAAIVTFISLSVFYGAVIIYQYSNGNFKYLNAPISSLLKDGDISIKSYMFLFVFIATIVYSFFSMILSLAASLLGKILR